MLLKMAHTGFVCRGKWIGIVTESGSVCECVYLLACCGGGMCLCVCLYYLIDVPEQLSFVNECNYVINN